jgi:hypothetical protein
MAHESLAKIQYNKPMATTNQKLKTNNRQSLVRGIELFKLPIATQVSYKTKVNYIQNHP